MSDFIPNSYQTPNAYADKYMAFLTAEEWKVLSYTMRRIFGFQRDRDRISLSQYKSGLKDEQGTPLDHGTGLCQSAIRTALDNLIAFGLIILHDPGNRHQAAEYGLQLDSAQVREDLMGQRRDEQVEKARRRSQKARGKSAVGQLTSVGQKTSVGQHTGDLSDSTPVICRTEGQNTVETQGKPESEVDTSVGGGAKTSKPWDVLGDAIATHLFDAKDRAGINAVYGRVAPILHGDKKHGRSQGLIIYECERQGVKRDQLDFDALAKAVPVFWADYQALHPGVTELKDCVKVLDAWQAWRGKTAKPARILSSASKKCPDCGGSHLIDYVKENGLTRRAIPGDRLISYTAPCPTCRPEADHVAA